MSLPSKKSAPVVNIKRSKKTTTRDKAIAELMERERKDIDNSSLPPCPESCRVSVGDEVEVGHLKDATAVAVSDDGNVVVVEFFDNNVPSLRSFDWTSVRKRANIKETKFASKSRAVEALSLADVVSNDISSLISSLFHSGLFFDKEYQRDYVWDDADREALISSIFAGKSIGSPLFIRNRMADDYRYEVLDGQQRVTTILDFVCDKFPYKGVYWSEMSSADQRAFQRLRMSYTVLEGTRLTAADKLEIFLLVNDSGVPQDPKHLDGLREKLKQINDKVI